MKPVTRWVTSTIAALAAFVASTPAPADLATRTVLQQASGICGANNPANNVYLRRLPTGLKNSGLSSISVVCSQWGDDANPQPALAAYVYFKNDKTVGGNVYCTLTMGKPSSTYVAITRGVYVPAGGIANVFWDQTAYGSNTDKQWINLQCSIPPGYAMREIGLMYDEEIGS